MEADMPVASPREGAVDSVFEQGDVDFWKFDSSAHE